MTAALLTKGIHQGEFKLGQGSSRCAHGLTWIAKLSSFSVEVPFPVL